MQSCTYKSSSADPRGGYTRRENDGFTALYWLECSGCQQLHIISRCQKKNVDMIHEDEERWIEIRNGTSISTVLFNYFSTFGLLNCTVRVREFQLSRIRIRKKAAD